MKRFALQLILAMALCCGLVLGVFGFGLKRAANDLVVHEWGTFTSIQGSDGVPLVWTSTNVVPLPSFVYDWKRPGLQEGWQALSSGGKGSIPMMVQRMETPVVYFYSPREETVDLQVRFPRGKMTEWYPRAAMVGPSSATNSPANVVAESLLHWPQIHVLPSANGLMPLPQSDSGKHYFAARETDSDFVHIDSAVTNPSSEVEKFLFYRGVGNFNAPLKLSVNEIGTMILENTGKEALHDLFLLHVLGGNAWMGHISTLAPKEQQKVQVECLSLPKSVSDLSETLGRSMAEALVRQGLYPREATAMVNTWKDSWFAEEGIRVLYPLPRKFTDEILPMEINPRPRQLVRVMVGRAEAISPMTENDLADAALKASKGDFDAKVHLHQVLAQAGRFADPVLMRALRTAKRADLFYATRQAMRGDLMFDAETKDVAAKSGETEVKFAFKIANFSAKEVVIERAQGSCGCTYATLPSQPWRLPAGATGELPVRMVLTGKPPGEISKEVTLYTSVGMRKLTVKTVVPSPSTVKTASLTH